MTSSTLQLVAQNSPYPNLSSLSPVGLSNGNMGFFYTYSSDDIWMRVLDQTNTLQPPTHVGNFHYSGNSRCSNLVPLTTGGYAIAYHPDTSAPLFDIKFFDANLQYAFAGTSINVANNTIYGTTFGSFFLTPLTNGGVAVLWQQHLTTPDTAATVNLFYQFMDSAGNLLNAPTLITSAYHAAGDTNDIVGPAIATLNNGNVIVSWTLNTYVQHSSSTMGFGQLVSSNGNLIGQPSELGSINTVVPLTNGGFAVVYSINTVFTSGSANAYCIYAKTYDENTVPVVSAKLVSCQTVQELHDNFGIISSPLQEGGLVIMSKPNPDANFNSIYPVLLYTLDNNLNIVASASAPSFTRANSVSSFFPHVIELSDQSIVATWNYQYSATDIIYMNRLAPNFTNIANINQVPTAGQVTTSLPAGNATVIDVVPYGSDPDNDSIQLYAVTPPAHGAASIVSGKIYYTSPNYYSGGDQFNYTILDGHGGYATNQVRVIVTFVNHAPIANNGAFTLYNTAAPLLNVTAFAYDLDQGDNVHVSAVSAPSHGSAVIQSGLVKYTPATNYIGLDSFIYTVTDTHNTNTTASISLTVKGLPAASVVTVSVNEESAILIDVLAAATDPNGDSLSIASLSTPGHGTAVIQAGQALYTPTPYYVGSDSFTYSVTDGTGGNATASVQITVLHINHAPVANNNAAQIYVNSPTTISVIANDSDYDNDSLTVISATTPSHGTTIIQANEALYTPSTDYHGSDSFNYTITDGNGGSASAQVMVSILQLPFIQPIAATLDENSNKLINVLDGSSDANGYNLDLYSVTTPAHGSATIQSGQVLYTPTLYYFGADSFNYTVSNAHNGYSSQIVSITITRIDIPPVVADFVQVTPINASVSIDVLAQASTPQSSTLSILSVETPSNGIANIVSGQISYTPNANYHGQDTFSYTVTDNYNEQNIGNITIFMNTIPVANMDSKNITQNQAQQLDVLGNDIDDDGDSLTLVSVTPAAHGLVNIVNNQAFYIPNTGYVGTDSFNYTVADGYPSGYANATVDLQINAPEDSTYAAFVGFATSTAGIATFAAVGAALLIGTITGIVFAVRHHNAKKIDSLYHDTLSGQSIALSTFALTAANAHSAQAEALPQHHQDAVGEYAIEAEHPLHAQQAEAPIF